MQQPLTTADVYEVLEWFRTKRIIIDTSNSACPKCNNLMNITDFPEKRNKIILQCQNCTCGNTMSILNGSLFEGDKMALDSLYLLYFHYLLNEFSSKFIEQELKINGQTLRFHKRRFRDKIIEHLSAHPIIIGGSGHRVEVEEIELLKLCKSEMDTPDTHSTLWILSLHDKTSNRLYAEIMPNRNASVILKILMKHVSPGSTIITDEWLGYVRISQLIDPYSKLPVYNYGNFNPKEKKKKVTIGGRKKNSECELTVEQKWHLMKRELIGHGRRGKKEAESYLNEFLWRVNTRKEEKIDSLANILSRK